MRIPSIVLVKMLSTPIRASLFVLVPAAAFAGAADPSEGWLTYAVYRAPKATDIITSLSAQMTVPAKPLRHSGAPAFWFGTQTWRGDGALVQPIMSKWLGDGFFMFQVLTCALPNAAVDH